MIMNWLRRIVFAAALAVTAYGAESAAPRLTLRCSGDNDLFRVLTASGYTCQRVDSNREAVERTGEGGAVLILADGYPAAATVIEPDVLEAAKRKNLRLYLEYPAALPGVEIGAPKTAGCERAVVNSDFFGPSLSRLRILAINGLHFVPAKSDAAHVVAARVAGFDTAVYGLPKETTPILFELPGAHALVATTKLSHFIAGRYAPQDAWQALWAGVLAWLCPGAERPALVWTPTVRPSYGRDELLPADAELQAVKRGAGWFHRSKLLLHPSRLDEVNQAAQKDGLVPTPPPDAPEGDGTFGILEAPLSIVLPDGSQMQGVSRRGDCHGESAMALTFGARMGAGASNTEIARNLLDYYLFTSDARKKERGDPKHGAYGLIAWGTSSTAWSVANYGDDNARLLMGVAATAALLGENRWDEAMTRCLLANLRTTGRRGFRDDRIDIPALSSQGWQPFFRRSIVSYSPHMEAYLWACYLWAYQQTGYELFYERAENAVRMTMKQYPNGWRWTNGLAQEKARILLPLAWLVRVKDTPEHRAWLRTAVDGLVALQEPCGAIREELGIPGKGMFPPPSSNEQYGGGEASLIQRNGDPVSDLLYTVNFAFLGLHEAAGVGDDAAKGAEEKLAGFLCRIQNRSEAQPSLDGGWFRAFDFKRWEAWASNADAGWGAWAIESGWTQGWITSVLGMRQMKTSLWSLVTKTGIAHDFDRRRREMLPDEVLQSLTPITVQHEAVGKPVTLRTGPSASYPGGGPSGLTDGRLGGAGHADPEWLGFEGTDLEATIDLGAPTAIRKLSAGFLQSTSVGIYLPPRVECDVSDDGVTFRPASRVQAAMTPDEAGPTRVLLASEALDLRARYVRVHAMNFGKIPAGKPGAGAAAWLFVDEVVVNNASANAKQGGISAISLTLIPPSPVTDRIDLDIRGSMRNNGDKPKTFDVAVYLDEEKPERRLHQEALTVAPQSAAGFKFRWPTQGNAGRHRIILTAQSGDATLRMERPIESITSDVRSTRRLGGAWVDIYHHDEGEGKPFNVELGKMTDGNWRELVRAMHATDQNLLVITMMFQNFTHRAKHSFTPETYPGKAYYSSKLYPARMTITSEDPLETILDEADKLGMHIMPGIGTYAFFDYTPDSLRWCKNVADEIWERYGHHSSFYGWYLSHEQCGGLFTADLGDPALQRREMIEFFKTFTSHVKRLAPDKPVLLATNPHGLRGAEETYRQLLPQVDILGPFGFHRMPEGDLTGEQAATLLQSLCDESGTHLWLDLETFVFKNGAELHPRPLKGLISDFRRFPNFEKILHYQFPGMMSAPEMTRQPGGPASVKLYEDYKQYLKDVAKTEGAITLIPWPAKLERRTGDFTVTAGTVIRTDSAMREVGRYLAESLRAATGFELALQENGGNQTGAIEIVGDANAGGGDEGYRLEVRPDRVVIAASKPAGAFYACQTLRQLLPAEIMGSKRVNIRWTVPCVAIEDRPRFPWRGVLLDSGRSFHSKKFVLDFIDLIAGFKINVLQWHLTDDEGWRLEIPKFPNLVKPISKPLAWMNDGYYSQADIREIVAHAASRHVMIVPEIEMPGHCHALLINYPELAPVKVVERTGPDMPCRVLDLGNPKTLEFCQDVLQDVFRLFPSPYVHLGGDEAETEVWLKSPLAQAKMKELNLTDPARLQKWWMEQMAKFMHANGKISMAWGERLDLGMPLKGQIVQGWRGESEVALKAEYQTVNSENGYTYFDYGNVPGDGQLSVLPLEKVYAFNPLPGAGLTAGQESLVLGSIAPVWVASEKTMSRRLFPRLLAFSEVVWTPQSQRNYREFIERTRDHLPRLTAAGIDYFPSPGLNPLGVRHAALGKAYTLANAPDKRYPDRNGQLTNGKVAEADYLDPEWVGWWGQDFDALIDLGSVQTVASVAINCLQQIPGGVYLPPEVQFAVSRDGVEYRTLTTLRTDKPEGGTEALTQTFSTQSEPGEVRFVRVRARNMGKIPEGAAAAGQPAWLFIDEIMVNPTSSKRD